MFAEDIIEYYPPVEQMRDTHKAALTHAYVILAYLGGITEYARATGNSQEIEWIEGVWEDLAANHVYPTGSLGFDERLRPDAPNDKPVYEGVNWRNHQETCATVEWIIFNKRLYETTGRVRYMHAIENTIYNALPAAQSPGGMKWMYYTPLRYEKKWFNGPTRCSYFSGPRGIVLLPSLVYAVDRDGLIVNLFEDSSATFTTGDVTVGVKQRTRFPSEGSASFSFQLSGPVRFGVKLRIPGWAEGVSIGVNNENIPPESIVPGRYFPIQRTWNTQDLLELEFTIPAYLRAMGDHGHALVRGAEVLAVNAEDNPGIELDAISLSEKSSARISRIPGSKPIRYRASVYARGEPKPKKVRFIPFAYAGSGSRYRTVFPLKE